jgi:hypothetical protein
MSSLTESSLIYNDYDNKPKKPAKEWYDNVYLCVEKNGSNEHINGFKCYTFKDFLAADTFYKKNYTNIKNRQTIIPVCKWIPFIFHKCYLNYSLKKLYWKNDITIFRNEKYI